MLNIVFLPGLIFSFSALKKIVLNFESTFEEQHGRKV